MQRLHESCRIHGGREGRGRWRRWWEEEEGRWEEKGRWGGRWGGERWEGYSHESWRLSMGRASLCYNIVEKITPIPTPASGFYVGPGVGEQRGSVIAVLADGGQTQIQQSVVGAVGGGATSSSSAGPRGQHRQQQHAPASSSSSGQQITSGAGKKSESRKQSYDTAVALESTMNSTSTLEGSEASIELLRSAADRRDSSRSV